MVSQNPFKSDVLPSTAVSDRGFVSAHAEEVAISGDSKSAVWRYQGPFWGPVIGGALTAISVFALSWYLMLGCHVGITEGGIISLGPGAAVWMWITACIAYYFAGTMATMLSSPSSRGWMTGTAVWSLSIPLTLVVFSFAARGGEMVSSLNLPHAQFLGMGEAHFGFFWAAFIGLLCGLVFSVIGSMTGCACEKQGNAS